MSVLFLDLATSGLYRTDLPRDHSAQPFAVKLAFEHSTHKGHTLSRLEGLVKPSGRYIDPGAVEAHGIGQKMAERYGVAELYPLIYFAQFGRLIDEVVTFSKFDLRVMDSILTKLALELRKPQDHYVKIWRRPGIRFLDIQTPLCRDACRIPGEDGAYRLPSLNAAGEIILGLPSSGNIRDPWADLGKLKRLYFHFKDLNAFEPVIETTRK